MDNQKSLLTTVLHDRLRRESGFSSDDGSCNGFEYRRDSYDSGLSESIPSSPSHTVFSLEMPNQNSVAKSCSTSPQKRKKKKKRLCESFSVAHFHDVYQLTGEVLGEGSYGRVETCINRITNAEYAVKIISKHSWHFSRPKILQEIELYHMCQGQREIIQMIEYFEENDDFYLVFEKAKGGPLLNQIQRRGHFTEKDAASVIRDLASALAFLHGKGIAHRDLKPENILCSESGDNFFPIKLCDFDLCSAVYQTITTPKLQSPVGSVEYMAPEVVEAFAYDLDFFMDEEDDDDDGDLSELSYDKRCDLWSLGIIAYILLCGYLPFNGSCGADCGWEDRGEECPECQHRLFQAITAGNLVFPQQHWSGVSTEAKDLIAKLLVRDASQRINAASILNHPWIVKGGKCDEAKDGVDKGTKSLETPFVLRRRHKSIADINRYSEFTTNALAIKRNCDESRGMKKSATVIDFQDETVTSKSTTPRVDIARKPRTNFYPNPTISNQATKMMRRQTSLVVFPEYVGSDRWEF